MLIHFKLSYASGRKEAKENEIWIDCDKLLIDDLLKHIKKYTFRKNLHIEDISEQLKIWSITVIPDISEELNLSIIEFFPVSGSITLWNILEK